MFFLQYIQKLVLLHITEFSNLIFNSCCLWFLSSSSSMFSTPFYLCCYSFTSALFKVPKEFFFSPSMSLELVRYKQLQGLNVSF